MQNVLLIVNPYSGRGVGKQKLGDIADRFARRDCGVFVCYTTPERGAEELARTYGARFDIVVCVGGDGTLSDVVSGLVTLENPPLIGYIPAGTANDVANTLALSRDVATAVETVLTGEPIEMDVGHFAGGYFAYIAAFGAFANTSYQTSQSAKRAFGQFAYVLGGIADLAQVKPYAVRVTYDGGVIEDEFIMGCVSNSTSVAGIVKLKPDLVDLSDGMFEVFLIKNPMNLAQFGEIMRDITHNTFSSDYVTLLHTSRISFVFDEPVKWTRDGEPGGEFRELEIVNMPRAVRVIRPKQMETVEAEIVTEVFDL